MGGWTRIPAPLAAILFLAMGPPAPATAQSYARLSVGVGSFFDGVSIGFQGGHAYGRYADGVGYARDAYCWDRYGGVYSDPWDDAYYDCLAYGPVIPYRASHPGHRWDRRFGFWYGSGYAGSAWTYLAAPWSSPWGYGPVYDPWGRYWNGARGAWGWDRLAWSGYGRSWTPWRATRVIYARGGGGSRGLYRPAVFQRSGPQYKERPGGRTARARPRGSTGKAVIQGSPRTPRGSAVPAITGRRPAGSDAVGRRATGRDLSARPGRAPETGTRSATPRRPTARVAPDRSAPSSGRRGTSAARPQQRVRPAPTGRHDARAPRRAAPVRPSERLERSGGAGSAGPSRPTRPSSSARPTRSTRPTRPSPSARPSRPSSSARPTRSVRPSRPSRSARPAQRARPSRPAKASPRSRTVRPAPARPSRPSARPSSGARPAAGSQPSRRPRSSSRKPPPRPERPGGGL